MMQMKISANQVSVRNGTVGDDCCPKEGIPICADTEMQSRSHLLLPALAAVRPSS